MGKQRVPPSSEEHERFLLSALMRAGKSQLHQIRERISPEMFHHYYNVAGAALELANEDVRPDAETLEEKVDLPEGLRDVSVPPQNADYYIEKVREKHLLRKIIAGLTPVVSRAYDEEDPEELRQEAEEELLEVSREAHPAVARAVGAYVDEVIERIETNEGEEVTGIPLGIEPIDTMLRGLQDSAVYLIAGRPHMGKTQFTLQGIKHAAKQGHRMAIITTEMTAAQLTMRLIFHEAGVKDRNDREYTEEEWVRLMEAKEILSKIPLFIVDTPSLSPQDSKAVIQRLVYEKGAEAVALDYLQNMTFPGSGRDWLGWTVKEHKSLAKALGIPIIDLSQLNRKVENRSDKKPRMADLRESGRLEEGADVIAFLYRPEYYDISVDENGRSTEGVAKWIQPKDRLYGELGTREMHFGGEGARFTALEQRRDPPAEKSENVEEIEYPNAGDPQAGRDDDAPF